MEEVVVGYWLLVIGGDEPDVGATFRSQITRNPSLHIHHSPLDHSPLTH